MIDSGHKLHTVAQNSHRAVAADRDLGSLAHDLREVRLANVANHEVSLTVWLGIFIIASIIPR